MLSEVSLRAPGARSESPGMGLIIQVERQRRRTRRVVPKCHTASHGVGRSTLGRAWGGCAKMPRARNSVQSGKKTCKTEKGNPEKLD